MLVSRSQKGDKTGHNYAVRLASHGSNPVGEDAFRAVINDLSDEASIVENK